MARLGAFDVNTNPLTWWDATADVGGRYTDELVPGGLHTALVEDDGATRSLSRNARSRYLADETWSLKPFVSAATVKPLASDDVSRSVTRRNVAEPEAPIGAVARRSVTPAEDAAAPPRKPVRATEESHPFAPTYQALRPFGWVENDARAKVYRAPQPPDETYPVHPGYLPLSHFAPSEEPRPVLTRRAVADDGTLGSRTGIGSLAWTSEDPRQPRALTTRALDDLPLKSATTAPVTRPLAAEDTARAQPRTARASEESHPFAPTYFQLAQLSWPDETQRPALVRPRILDEAGLSAKPRAIPLSGEDATPARQPRRSATDESHPFAPTYSPLLRLLPNEEPRQPAPRIARPLEDATLKSVTVALVAKALPEESTAQRAPRLPRAIDDGAPLGMRAASAFSAEDARARPIRGVGAPDDSHPFAPSYLPVSRFVVPADDARPSARTRPTEDAQTLKGATVSLPSAGWRSEDMRSAVPKRTQPDDSVAFRPALVSLFAFVPSEDARAWPGRRSRADDAGTLAAFGRSSPLAIDDGAFRWARPPRAVEEPIAARGAFTAPFGWAAEDSRRQQATRRSHDDQFPGTSIARTAWWYSDDTVARAAVRRPAGDEPPVLSAVGYALALQGWRSEDPSRVAARTRFPDDSPTGAALARSFGWQSSDLTRRPLANPRAEESPLGSAVRRSLGWIAEDSARPRPVRFRIEEAPFGGFLHYTHPTGWLLDDAQRSPWRQAVQPIEPWFAGLVRVQMTVLLVMTRPVNPIWLPQSVLNPNLAPSATLDPILPIRPTLNPIMPYAGALNPSLSTTRALNPKAVSQAATLKPILPANPALNPNLASATGALHPQVSSATEAADPILPATSPVNPKLPPTRVR